jgi:Tfp pilus assembly protein PilO
MNDKKNLSGNTLLLLSGIVVVLLMILNIAKIKSISETSAQIETEASILDEQKAYQDELKKLTLIRPELEKAHRILSVKIPKRPEEDKLIEYIDKLTKENKTSFIHIQFEKRTVNSDMTEMPIQLMFSGKYTSLMEFIRSISEGERLIRIDGLQIDRGDSDGSINASITAKAFFK